MINAYFYKYSKRENSTARPADNAGLLNKIALKKDTDLNHPEILLYLGMGASPEWNYIYIPDLGRYYFVESWQFVENRNWSASCTVDVLASYKYEIGYQEHYVVRSASRRNEKITDLLYPASTDVTTQVSFIQSLWMNNNEISINNGTFIVGIDSYDARYGSLDYYMIGYNDLSDLCDYLVNDLIQNGVNGFTDTDASIALQRSLVNPLQFIKSCLWFPIALDDLKSLGSLADVYAFSYDTGVDGYRLGNKAVYDAPVLNVTRLSHPQASTHGAYMNSAPFTDVQLKIPPFGIIDLDATVIANAESIAITHTVDLITGKVIAELKSGVKTMNRISTQLGVPIQLSQITRDYIGAVTSAVSAVGSALTGNFIGAANGIGNAISSGAPKVNSVGSNGGFCDLYGDIELIYTFYTQTDVNNEERGRPLMKKVMLNTLSGYMEVEHADIDIPCTAEESTMIRDYLESGFYYE